MIAHEAPTQLLSLLMIHGYLEWAGDYGGTGRPRRGALLYSAGAVLGIATGWAALLAAGLLWAWHAGRVARRHGEARMLFWLALVPGLALTAVVLHIAAGCGWDFGVFAALLGKRSLAGEGGRQPWSAWLGMQWLYVVRNFTWPGVLAALLTALLLPGTRLRAARGSASFLFPLAGKAGSVTVLCGLQGLLWMVGLKNQSWYHDYWQFFLAPAVALGMAGLVLAVHARLAPRAPRLAGLAVALLLLSPMPFAAAARDFYAGHRLVDPESIRALSDLGRLLPHRAPVWTSHRTPESSETFGHYVYRWPNPILTYYANRPLFFSRDVREVEANAPRCAAYLLKRSEQPWARELELALSRSFEAVPVGDQHVVFLLDRPLRAPGAP
jgi:hypothetical protein